MGTYWQSEFKRRMQDFGGEITDDFIPVSIKVRVTSGCFHREHSPKAYQLIDRYVADGQVPETNFRFEEHESGPELLVYLALGTAGLGLLKSVIELVTAIIKARSEGVKKGDRPAEPLELIVRGHSKDGEYFEEKVLRIPAAHAVTAKQIQDALEKAIPKKPIEKAVSAKRPSSRKGK